ncbi:hypothetical protein [Granulibacter bethesdensis]|uniref:hypothetical protein n=1 Tax=Granulibacter bethesdensis TaxID=364410 RepID=UPI0012FE03C6|nr:hypothetical protein [Granulibacter bethesdensis]
MEPSPGVSDCAWACIMNKKDMAATTSRLVNVLTVSQKFEENIANPKAKNTDENISIQY